MEIYIAICLDIDRDAPYPVNGISHGVCLPYHNLSPEVWKDPKNFTIEATILGLKNLLTIFEEENYPFNCFIEASIIEKLSHKINNLKTINRNMNCDLGLHGLYHEDLSGEQTGIYFTRKQEEFVLNEACNIFKNSFGIPPIGFRTPYLKFSENTFELLEKKKFLYDSSKIVTSKTIPQVEKEPMSYIPILRYETRQKPFISYFWTLFEKIRPLEEIIKLYTKIINSTKQRIKNEKTDSPYILTLNLHPWHLAYFVKDKKYVDEKGIIENINNLKKILDSFNKNENVSFVQISEII